MEPEGELHPLVPTGRPRPGDTSFDTSADRSQHGFDEDMETERVFGVPGIDTQGPTGVPVPEWQPPKEYLDRQLEEELRQGYMDDEGEAPPDSAGPVAPLDSEADEYATSDALQASGAVAASNAVVRARRAGKDGLAVMDELEAAEEAYEQQHAPLSPQRQRSLAASATSFGEGGGGGVVSPRRAQQAQQEVGAETRQRVVEKLGASLAANSGFAAGRSPEAIVQAAQECERALLEGSHSKGVYLSKASNAVRVARTVADVADLPRIASGEPRQAPGSVREG
ncbi:hypothetical protein N2152v2_006647 [Parachlorella kessleri]